MIKWNYGRVNDSEIYNCYYSVNFLIKQNILTTIIIPGYDNTGNGIYVKLKITVNNNNVLSISCKDNTTVVLERNFTRIISIMASLKKEWQCLQHLNYQLECDKSFFKVNDARSSSMALSIALLNIYREINNKCQIKNITGTGILRIDGSFDEAYLEQQKHFAVKNNVEVQKEFITSNRCSHLFELEDLLEQYKITGDVK